MLLTAIVLILFGWSALSGRAATPSLTVSSTVAILAGVSLVLSFALYVKAPYKYITAAAAIVYALLVAVIGWAVVETGGASSPLIALWLAVGVFSGIFGWWGMGVLLLLANAYIVYHFLQGNTTNISIVLNMLAAEVPILASYLLWNERESVDILRDHDVSSLNKSLEQESSKSDAIIQSISDGVAVISPTGELQMINPAAESMTGWSAKDAVHLHYSAIFKLQDDKGNQLENNADPILQALNTGQPARASNVNIITKSNKRIAAAFAISPMGVAGEGAIAVFRDVTKERAEERQQAEFISTASHEMRTPVASIEGYLGLALNPATAQIDEKARDYINKAHESAQHLGRLFQDLLDVSRADDGRLQSTPTAINVVEFARDIVEGLSPKASEKKLTILFKPDGGKATTVGSTVIAPMLFAHVDKDHLREVISNLVENAIKYTLEGHIELDVTATDNYVRISVKDSGIGIPAEDMSHLFQKFYRVDNSDTREIGGTGLGLYLCRRLTEAMNGRIWAESEYKKGSTFFVELPRLDHARANAILENEKRSSDTAKDKPSREGEAHDQPATQPIATPAPEPTPTPSPSPVPTTPPPATQPPAPETPAPALVPPTLPPELQTPDPTHPPVPQTTPPEPQPIPLPTLPPNPFGAIPYGEEDPSTDTAQTTPVTVPATSQPPIVPTPTQAAPAPSPVQAYTRPNPMTGPTEAPRVNTPLTSLEANPERYTVSPHRPSDQSQNLQ